MGRLRPRRIVYSPRVFDYAVEAVEAWNREVLGVTWTELNGEMRMGAPVVRAECDYLLPLKPDQEIEEDVVDIIADRGKKSKGWQQAYEYRL